MKQPNSLDDDLLIARRFEAANATMKTLAREAVEMLNNIRIGSVNSLKAAKTSYLCNNRFGSCVQTVPYYPQFQKNNSQQNPDSKLHIHSNSLHI